MFGTIFVDNFQNSTVKRAFQGFLNDKECILYKKWLASTVHTASIEYS